MFPETTGKSLEELAFCTSHLPSTSNPQCSNVLVSSVFEGDIRAEQEKRVEEQIHEDDLPVSPGSEFGKDKEGGLVQHLEK